MKLVSGKTLTVFFTFGMSLEGWVKAGLFEREVKLYRELCREGIAIQFVTYGDAKDRHWETRLNGIQVVPVYEYVSRPRTMFGQLIKSFYIPWAIQSNLSKSDLFKTNQMMGAWVAVIAKLRFRKPLLVRCGYEMFEFLRFSQASRWEKYAGCLLSLASYYFADRIHVATKADQAVVCRRFRIPLHKIKIRPNWIDTREFAPCVVAKEQRAGLLFVGRLSDQKNLSLLVEAIAGIGQPLTVVGDGEEKELVQAKAEKLGVRVKFRGSIANDLLPKVYRQCAVYVICSRYEGNPKTLLEAMACGCAVLGTDVHGIREIIQHEQNGLLTAENPLALRAALLRLLDDENLRKQLADRARKSVAQEHSLESAVAAECKTYDDLLGSRETRATQVQYDGDVDSNQ